MITPITRIGRASPQVAKGATFIYEADFVDENEDPITLADLVSLSLEIVDENGTVVLSDTDILNTGRGEVDSTGHLILTSVPSDTEFSGGRSVKRSLKLKWVFNTDKVGRHQFDFWVLALAGD